QRRCEKERCKCRQLFLTKYRKGNRNWIPGSSNRWIAAIVTFVRLGEVIGVRSTKCRVRPGNHVAAWASVSHVVRALRRARDGPSWLQESAISPPGAGHTAKSAIPVRFAPRDYVPAHAAAS